MKPLSWVPSVALLFALPGPALADQCAWVSRDIADAAVRELKVAEIVVAYCELCKGDEPKIVSINAVKSQPADAERKYYEVHINGEGVDLAYVFVPAGEDRYENLGRRVKCGASGVSPYFRFEQGQQDPYRQWYGRFETADSRTATIIDKGKMHGPHWLEITFYLVSPGEPDSHGQISGYLKMDGEQPTYTTPIDGCALHLQRERSGLRVKPNRACGVLGYRLGGYYDRNP